MIIRELISGIRAGWHTGKGHKATRLGKYQKALKHYQLAVEYEKLTSKYGSGPNPVSLECIARTQARLGNYKDALTEAEKSYELYRRLNPTTKVVAESTKRIEKFINLLNTGNEEELKKFLII